jgi:DNA-binding CsgD family transcriptional regulator/tetratricopeptide (TPR) repeat protein
VPPPGGIGGVDRPSITAWLAHAPEQPTVTLWYRPGLPLGRAQNANLSCFVDTPTSDWSAYVVMGAHDLAGRRAEVPRVQQALTSESGGSFLLVAGEAGVGKSRLVTAAIGELKSSDVIVLSGSCLPVVTSMPLLPIIAALRTAYEVDTGAWVKAALAECSDYVREVLPRLLPELATEQADSATGTIEDEWWRQRLFAAVRSTLAALADTRNAAIVLEDLHWADTATLDLLDYLLVPGQQTGLRIVATYRTDDPATAAANANWFARAHRLPQVEIMPLGRLSLAETAEQLALLSATTISSARVSEIYRLSEGNALFTEQLAGRSVGETGVPAGLSDLFEQSLATLTAPARLIATTMAIALRPVDDLQLQELTGLAVGVIANALRELADLQLLRRPRTDGGQHLRHALLAEAIQAQMLRAEKVEAHRRLALAMPGWSTHGFAAEIAAHWNGAGDATEELRWRVQAAAEAERLHASRQAADHWLQVLELWSQNDQPAKVSGLRLSQVYAAAEDALINCGNNPEASRLSAEALAQLAPTAEPAEQAEFYRRAGVQGGVAFPLRGLELLAKAIGLHESLGPSAEFVATLRDAAALSRGQARYAEAARFIDRGLTILEELDLPREQREMLSERAWADMEDGDPDAAISRIESAWGLPLTDPDPRGDIWLSCIHTDILLKTAGAPADAERAARPGLTAIARLGLNNTFVSSILLSNLAQAYLAAGDVDGAAARIDPITAGPASSDLWAIYSARAELEMLRGNLETSAARFAELGDVTITSLSFQGEVAYRYAELELWTGKPQSALDRLLPLLQAVVHTRESRFTGILFLTAARAVADLASSATPTGQVAADASSTLLRLHASAELDPFAHSPAPVYCDAEAAQWTAELGRLHAARDTATSWRAAAESWEALNRPHRTAYCRWRLAEALLQSRSGRGEAADALRSAIQQARGHVPLTDAVRALARAARVDLTVNETPVQEKAAAPTPYGLTPRELDVLRLVCDGRSNNEIGATLFMSPKTASVHVTSILRKLDATTRAHAATVAARAGLVP